MSLMCMYDIELSEENIFRFNETFFLLLASVNVALTWKYVFLSEITSDLFLLTDVLQYYSYSVLKALSLVLLMSCVKV